MESLLDFRLTGTQFFQDLVCVVHGPHQMSSLMVSKSRFLKSTVFDVLKFYRIHGQRRI
jgi:hypothetical protein